MPQSNRYGTFPEKLPYIFDTIHALDVIHKFIDYHQQQVDEYWILYRQGYPLAFYCRERYIKLVAEGKHYLDLWEAKYLSEWLLKPVPQMRSITERHLYP